MPIPIEIKCFQYGDHPQCEGTIDPQYTQNFDDIGEPPIHMCATCGPVALALLEIFLTAFEKGDSEFKNKAIKLITSAEEETSATKN